MEETIFCQPNLKLSSLNVCTGKNIIKIKSIRDNSTLNLKMKVEIINPPFLLILFFKFALVRVLTYLVN